MSIFVGPIEYRLIVSDTLPTDRSGHTCAVLFDHLERTVTIGRWAPVDSIARGIANGISQRLRVPIAGKAS